MTIHHLASMTSGFPKPGDINCTEPLLFPPGTDFAYSDGSSNILGEIIKRALNVKDIRNALENDVLTPIGANNWTWDGRFNAGLHISVRDMVRYGRLWLRKGDWDGKRIFSEKYAIKATKATNPELMKSYGYFWWVNSQGKSDNYEKYGFKLSSVFDLRVPRDAYMAIGASFTFILVIPSQNLIAVRSGVGFHSIQSGDTLLSDVSREFVNYVLDVIN
jgi:CubicO group peptidase (beta-lactamase class C family)